MKKNKLTVIIRKPVDEVFEFIINPDNTHRWIKSIVEEKTDDRPIKIGSIYKNRGKDDKQWSEYEVVELKPNKLFTLRKNDWNYYVQYSYQALDDFMTKLIYLEWVEEGELEDPFNQGTLDRLKVIMETDTVNVVWLGK